MKTLLLILIVSINLIDLGACQCREDSDKMTLRNYDTFEHIIHGKVLDLKVLAESDWIEVKIEVHGIRKLIIDQDLKFKYLDTIKVYTPSTGLACGYNFEKDKRYLIYTQYENDVDGENKLITKGCMPTKPFLLDDNTAEVKLKKEFIKELQFLDSIQISRKQNPIDQKSNK